MPQRIMSYQELLKGCQYNIGIQMYKYSVISNKYSISLFSD